MGTVYGAMRWLRARVHPASPQLPRRRTSWFSLVVPLVVLPLATSVQIGGAPRTAVIGANGGADGDAAIGVVAAG